MADAVGAGIEVRTNRSLLVVEDAVPMFLAAFFQCAVSFPYVSVTTQAARYRYVGTLHGW